MPRYDDWMYDRVPRSRYDERFRADRWGYYRGGSHYWGPPPIDPGWHRYGADFRAYRGHDRVRGYDRHGGYAGGLLARGWGFRNDPYQPDWEWERGRGRAYRFPYDRGW